MKGRIFAKACSMRFRRAPDFHVVLEGRVVELRKNMCSIDKFCSVRLQQVNRFRVGQHIGIPTTHINDLPHT